LERFAGAAAVYVAISERPRIEQRVVKDSGAAQIAVFPSPKRSQAKPTQGAAKRPWEKTMGARKQAWWAWRHRMVSPELGTNRPTYTGSTI
jgi:hypothetical protein